MTGATLGAAKIAHKNINEKQKRNAAECFFSSDNVKVNHSTYTQRLTIKNIRALTLTEGETLITHACAVIIDASTIILDENILLNFYGLNWVYADSIPSEYFEPGNLETPKYRAGKGWRYAINDE